VPKDKQDVELFLSGALKYRLIGGYAVAYHGYPRATADMDVWKKTRKPQADLKTSMTSKTCLDQVP
jgi:hypothetical protein